MRSDGNIHVPESISRHLTFSKSMLAQHILFSVIMCTATPELLIAVTCMLDSWGKKRAGKHRKNAEQKFVRIWVLQLYPGGKRDEPIAIGWWYTTSHFRFF